MDGQRIAAIGAPLDCSGSGRGEGDAPAAFRAAGLLGLLDAHDAGDVHDPITEQGRDEASGVLALDAVRDATEAIAAAVDGVYHRGAVPLVIGGDCSIVIGALAGARKHHTSISACFLDGHLDSHDGSTSISGEVADMDIGVVCGHGPAVLRGLKDAPDPLVEPSACVIIGNRFHDDRDSTERELVDPLIQQIEGPAVNRGDASEIGRRIADRLSAQSPALWLHIDCDVLDADVMPAVTYPQPDGLGWDDFEALIHRLVEGGRPVGISLADFVPGLDTGGIVGELVDRVARALRPWTPSR